MAQDIKAWQAQQRTAMEVQLQLEQESLARLEAAKEKAGASNPSAHGGGAFGESGDDPAWDEPGMIKVAAGFTANVWDIKVKPGDTVEKGDTVIVLEAMKMESPVLAPVSGTVKAIAAEQGALAAAGQVLLVIEEEPALVAA